MAAATAMFELGSYYTFEDINEAAVAQLKQFKQPGAPALLDVGCGRARLGQAIEALGYRVTGIESNAEACLTARSRVSEVIQADLGDQHSIEAAISDRKFDWLMFADVLEHVPDPLTILRSYRERLTDQGRLIISLPNVAVWDNRLKVLAGRFDYADSGVMDRTHLRFFTFRTAKLLLIEAGFTPVSVSFEPGIVRAFLPLIKRLMAGGGKNEMADPGLILQSRPYRLYQRYVLPIEQAICSLARGLLAFRIVIVAEKAL